MKPRTTKETGTATPMQVTTFDALKILTDGEIVSHEYSYDEKCDASVQTMITVSPSHNF